MNQLAGRRVWRAVIALLLALMLVGTGLFIGQRVKSPLQAAAENAPPRPSIVVANLESRTLTTEIVARGRPNKGGGLLVKSPPALATPDAVVTALHIGAGDRIRDGQLLMDVSGAPVIAAVLPFRLYRDVEIGSRGPDVVAFSRFLVRHGYLSSGSDTATNTTLKATRRFFSDRGYPHLLDASGPTPKASAAPDKSVTDAPRGIVVRQAWILRMDKAGRRVSRLSVSVGEDVSGAETLLLECDRKPPSVVARVDEDGAERLRVGDKATITDEASNNTVEARVKTIARSSKSGAEADATGRPVTLVAAGGSTLSGLPDDVRVTITSAVAAEPVLTVPVSAVYTDELGASRVVLANGDERGATVDVTLGPCVSGWCQILDSGSEELIEGAAVVVGERAGK